MEVSSANGRNDLSVHEVFGSYVLSDAVMRERLPRNVYTILRRSIDEGTELDRALADVVANSMKDWAIEKEATHFCHWFQSMTGITADKHDSFISPTTDGRTIMEFSGKELIKGESRTRRRSLPAACAARSKRAGTRCGTAHLPCSARKTARTWGSQCRWEVARIVGRRRASGLPLRFRLRSIVHGPLSQLRVAPSSRLV